MGPYDDATGVLSRPQPLPGATLRWFTDGVPEQGVKGSVVTADFMNDLQASLLVLFAAVGITPTKGSGGDNDVLNAIRALIAAGTARTGDAKLTFQTVPEAGWILLNDGSIGSAASGGTTRANADCEALFSIFWIYNALDVPMQTAAGASVGRGASAAADWAANRRLLMPRALGRVLGVGGGGAGLTFRRYGEALGEEAHVLTTPEIPSHTHPLATPTPIYVGGKGSNSGSFTLADASSGNPNTGSAGGGASHNNMQPTMFMNVMVKL